MGMTGEQAYVLAKKLIEAGGGGGGTVDAYTKTQTDNLLIQKVDKEVLNNTISDKWNDKTTYEVGKYCIYANKLWKCLVQHSSQTPTEGTYWTQTSIDDEITELNSNIKNTLKTYEDNVPLVKRNDGLSNIQMTSLYGSDISNLPAGIYYTNFSDTTYTPEIWGRLEVNCNVNNAYRYYKFITPSNYYIKTRTMSNWKALV